MFQVLVVLSVVWIAILVLALVGYLGLTAFHLRRAKASVAGIADDLEVVADATDPLSDLVGEVAQHVVAIRDDMDAVNSGIGQVIEAVSKQPSTN